MTVIKVSPSRPNLELNTKPLRRNLKGKAHHRQVFSTAKQDSVDDFVQSVATASSDRPWKWVSLTGNLATECEYLKAGDCKYSTVGMFDSGVGGLTVFMEFRQRFPHINVVYFADMNRQPYGPRSQPQVAGFCHEILSFMKRQGCGFGVIACNTATAATFDFGVNENPSFRDFPIFGTIPFAAMAALEADVVPSTNVPRQSSKQLRIGVLATQGTCQSGAYARSLSCRASCNFLNTAATDSECNCGNSSNSSRTSTSASANTSANTSTSTSVNTSVNTSANTSASNSCCGSRSTLTTEPLPLCTSPVSVMCECPEFMGIAEAGTVLDPHTRKVAEQYMAPLRKKSAGGGGKVDALIYGCTHYPILKEVVEDVLYNSFGYSQSEVKLINPAETLVDKMESLISPPTLLEKKRGSVRFCVNADPTGFAERAHRILGYDVSTLCEVVDLQA